MDGDLGRAIDEVVESTGFAGAVHVIRGDEVLYARAVGDADRAHGLPNALDTRFAMASGCKGFTALAVMALVEDGLLTLDTTARSLLGDALPLIEAEVTVGHLLSHTSGIGDYYDEDAGGEIDDYVLPVPVHRLARTIDYVEVLDGFPTKFPAGSRFSYCNGGFVVLALLVEAASGAAFYDVVSERVLEPAGMVDTAYLRSDQLPGSAAIGYLPTADGGWRTNVFHLPVRGSGDGGAYTTVSDMARFWRALAAGAILPQPVVAEMTRPRNDVPSEGKRYGLGFWLRPDRPTVLLEGMDAGVSFQSAHDPASDLVYTVVSNTPNGAWPVVSVLEGRVPDLVEASSLP